MVRKIGNILLMFLYASLLHAVDEKSLRLMLTDLQNNKINQVEVGVPCLLQVIAKNIDYKGQPEGFNAWDNIAVSLFSQSNSMTSVNGVTSKQTTFLYVLTPHKKGTFSLSPLTITDVKSGVITSDTFQLVVGDAIQMQPQTGRQPYFLQIDLDSKSVYVGQKVSALIRFGYTDSFDNLHINISDMEHIHHGYVSQTGKQGKMVVHNVEYETRDFVVELYPQKEGNLVIPAMQANFTATLRFDNSLANMFAMVMGSGNVLQSQPRSLQVQSLPVSKEFSGVTAIGTFDLLEFTLSAKEGKVGEGLVAKMIIQGDGNLEIVKAPALHMPEGLHYYEGNCNLQRLDNGNCRKEFEWIVQADRAGNFKIPSQKFVYFDLALQKYAVLQTKDSTLVINGSAVDLVQEPSNHLQESDPIQPEVVLEQKSQDQKNSNEQTSHTKTLLDATLSALTVLQNSIASTFLTWAIGCLIALLLILLIVWFVKTYFKEIFFIQTLRYRFQFFMYRRNRDTKGMYILFENMMKKYGLELQSQHLYEYFIKLGLPEESYGNWQNFVRMILEINFTKDQPFDQKDLAFSLAKQWFAIILTCCKMHKSSHVSKQIVS